MDYYFTNNIRLEKKLLRQEAYGIIEINYFGIAYYIRSQKFWKEYWAKRKQIKHKQYKSK